MTSSTKGFHYGQCKNYELQELVTQTIVIGVVESVLGAVALSQKLSPPPTDTTRFQL